MFVFWKIFINLLILRKCLLSFCFMLDIVLSIGDIAVCKVVMIFVFGEIICKIDII